MGFEYLTNVPLDEARGEYLARLQENGFAGQTEMVSVQNAFGRITGARCLCSDLRTTLCGERNGRDRCSCKRHLWRYGNDAGAFNAHSNIWS